LPKNDNRVISLWDVLGSWELSATLFWS
jgi:hypothetical protein